MSEKRDYFQIFFYQIKVNLMGTVVNRALLSMHGESLEITLTVPLRLTFFIPFLFLCCRLVVFILGNPG